MLLIQIVNALLVFCYFNYPPTTHFLDKIGVIRDQSGVFFILITGMLAGGVLPEIAKILTGKVKKIDREWASHALYVALVYTVVGFEVHFLYIVQVLLFTESNALVPTIQKVLFDMLIFSPLLSIPYATGMFIWRQNKFKLSAWSQVLTPRNYMKNVFPGLILCWAFWTPVLSAIYLLPLKLQFPVAMLCESAWTIVFVFSVQEPQAEPVLVE
ncbi:MAG: hypothetical protein ACKVQS_06025 [Fimbriimonadaceae bacterium]